MLLQYFDLRRLQFPVTPCDIVIVSLKFSPYCVEILLHGGRALLLHRHHWGDSGSPGDGARRPGGGRSAVQPPPPRAGGWGERQRSGGAQQQRVWPRLPGPGGRTHCRVVSSLASKRTRIHHFVAVCRLHTTMAFSLAAARRDYPMMLSVFSKMLTKESDRRVIDNLCAALCRMIMSNVDAVPLQQVCC